MTLTSSSFKASTTYGTDVLLESSPTSPNSEAGQSESRHLLHHQHSSSVRLEVDVPYYAPPKQRQRWDDDQSPPIVNWGDLFWDLFYVSGAFNLAASLKESLNGIGLFYFVACYLSILQMWNQKLVFDARFENDDNLYYRFCEIINIVLLGTTVANIRPVQTMSDTYHNSDTFLFSFCLMLHCATWFARHLDVLWNVQGAFSESRHQARHDINTRLLTFVFYLLAATWSSRDLISSGSSAFSFGDNHLQQNDRGDEERYENHGPMILVLLGYVASEMSTLYWRFVYIPFLGVSHKKVFVPVNVDFVLHRLGEWTMLMLGESVLGLLIVEQSTGLRYYTTFYGGIITVSLFQYLYFRSQPFDPEDHALRRSSEGGYTYSYSHIAYSMSLILIGCSFKMILHYYLEEDEEKESGHALYENVKEEQSIANLFSWSMGLSFVTLDMMIISHRGWKQNFARFIDPNGRLAFMPCLITVLNYALIACLFTLSQWVNDLADMVALGMLVVSLQVLLRTRGLRYFPVSKQAMNNQGV